MNSNSGNVPRLFEAYVGPRVSAVRGFINAVSRRNKLSLHPLTRPHINNIGIREGDVQGTNRGKLKVVIRHVTPVQPGIRRLPDATMSGTEIMHQRVVDDSGYCEDTATTVWPNETPFGSREETVINAGIRNR